MSDDLEYLNKFRSGRFRKKEQEEAFLDEFNRYLFEKERKEYHDYPVTHPFIFVLGPPRSGTTLISQLIANTFDIGFINNLAARFYLAPLHGIRFSKAVLGDKSETDYKSVYAQTSDLSDIHEFGYFWRHWLKKQTLSDITHASEREGQIDWEGLKKCLTSIQQELQKGLVFKNIFGSYHMKRLRSLLDEVLFVYIERDELDTACSILEARKKYYGDDLEKWWSYAPPEVLELKEMDYWHQIAGQIVYLKRFYFNEFEKLPANSVIKVHYESLCRDPASVIRDIQQRAETLYSYSFNIIKTPPKTFDIRTYNDRNETKEIFKKLIDRFRTND